MARQSWNILANTFEVKTRGSYKKIYVFADRHYGALKGISDDAVIVGVFSSFEPVFRSFASEFIKWNHMKAEQEGATLDFNNTLLDIAPA